jgi:PAS domain S-box-containing protein
MKREDADFKKEIGELREKVRDLEETLYAIRSGEVDAIVISDSDNKRQVYTLEGVDHPYQVLVENIREGALTLSRTGMILYTNTRFAEMVEFSPHNVPGTSLLDYISPEYRREIDEALSNIVRNASRISVRIRQGTDSLPVLISMNALSSDENTKISVIITDRRKDEDRIQLQARMLDVVGDAVIAVDTDNKIIFWNEAATRTYGWGAEAVINLNKDKFLVPKISKTEAQKIFSQINEGKCWSGEYLVRHRDGYEFPVHAIDSPLFDNDGVLIAIISASHDISEQKRIDEERMASLQEKDVMLREIHHRVKNNLQLMSGLLDMTLMRTVDGPTRSVLTDMMLKIQTMAQIHNRLYVSKQFGKISLTGQIRDQITGLSEIFSHKGHEIHCEINPEEIFLPVDQALPCALVVNEVLSNAYKHAFKGRKEGTIKILALQENGQIRITVRDDGIGLPPLFDIGRINSLGIKLIRTLVERQLKGSLTFESHNGTEITVEFPVAGEVPSAAGNPGTAGRISKISPKMKEKTPALLIKNESCI